MRNVEAKVTLLDVAGLTAREPSFHAEAKRLSQLGQDRFTILDRRIVDQSMLQRHTLLLISYASWARLAESRSVWLTQVPSTLIVKP